MDQAFATVIGMSIAYVASFIGMGLAWYGWKQRREENGAPGRPREKPGKGDAGRGSGSAGDGP